MIVCPHETPGGAQRCALCRREVERLHDPHGLHAPVPYWKTTAAVSERAAVPMPDHVRELLHEMQQGRRRGGEQGRLL